MPATAMREPFEIRVGDRLRDNRPRQAGERVVTVERIELAADGGQSRLAARPPGGRLVWIRAARVSPPGPPARAGFTLVERVELDARVAPLIGKAILLRRGSGLGKARGCERLVRARLDAVDGIQVHATLLEEDPLATVPPFHAGDGGVWHGLSFVLGAAPA